MDKINFKRFDPEAAKAGAPVCTRDGQPASSMKHKESGPVLRYTAPAAIRKNHEPGAVFLYTIEEDGSERLVFVCNAATEPRDKKSSL